MEITALIRELERGLQVISDLVKDVTVKESRIKPDADNWSMLEVICHLVDEEREDFRKHIEQSLAKPQPAWHAIDPEGWVIERQYQAQSWKTKVSEFQTERESSLLWLSNLEGIDWSVTIDAPFGSISAGDLLSSWVMHDNLHIRQLIELRYILLSKKSKPFSTLYAGEW